MVQVRLFHFKRPEQKFDNVDELKKKIKCDVEEGLSYQHKK